MKTKAEILNTIEPRSVKLIGGINSWSDKVGDKGWQWLTEDYFTSGNVFSGWTHIFKAPEPINTVIPSFMVDMAFRDTSNEVIRLQSYLSLLGYFHAESTGYYGQLTRDAVYAFQKDYVKLSPWENFWQRGSRVGIKTRTALNNLIK